MGTRQISTVNTVNTQNLFPLIGIGNQSIVKNKNKFSSIRLITAKIGNQKILDISWILQITVVNFWTLWKRGFKFRNYGNGIHEKRKNAIEEKRKSIDKNFFSWSGQSKQLVDKQKIEIKMIKIFPRKSNFKKTWLDQSFAKSRKSIQ